MSDLRKDLPPSNSPNFLEKVREALSTYLGSRGSRLDRGLTVRDLADAGLVELNSNWLANGGGSNPITGPGSAFPEADIYEPDLTPPPSPTGFEASAAISNLLVSCDTPDYTHGHGHAKSRLYGMTYESGDLPVFADAQVITEFQGNMTAHATNPATTWHLWLTWVTVDGVESTTPAGGTNGLVARTGEDVGLLLEAMAGSITESELYGSLNARIDLIDGPDTTVGTVSYQVAQEAEARALAVLDANDARALADSILTTAIGSEQSDRTAEAVILAGALVAEAATRAQDIATEIKARGDAITEEANSRIESVFIEARDRADETEKNAESALRNLITSVNQAAQGSTSLALARSELTSDLQEGISAEAAQRATLEAKLVTEKGQTLALIESEQLARVTADTATASTITGLAAQVGGALAAVISESQARSTADEATAGTITVISSRVNDAETGLLAANALISSEAQTRATAVSAEASARELLKASLLGADGTGATSGVIYTERQTRVTQEDALAQQITLLSAGAGEQFDWKSIWYFDSGVESWTGNGTPTASSGFLRPANQASGAYVESPTGINSEGAKYNQLRLRVRKVGAPVWAGFLWWRAVADSTWDSGRRVTMTAPDWDPVTGIGLVTVNPGWAVTIDRIRVDLSSAQTATDYFELDWVAVGRPSPGASSAQLLQEQTVRAAADSANSGLITALTSTVEGESGLSSDTRASLVVELDTRATNDAANAQAISAMRADVGNSAAALVSAQTVNATADAANASSITAISSQVNNPTTGLAAAHAGITSEADTRATAVSAEAAQRVLLDARVQNNTSAIVSEAVSRANADSATASSLSALSSQVADPVTGLVKTRADLIVTQDTLATATTASALESRSLLAATRKLDEATLRGVLTGVADREQAVGTLALAREELRTDIVDGLSAEAGKRLALAAVVDGNSALFVAEQTTRTTQFEAVTSNLSTLGSTVGSNTAALVVEQETRAAADAASASQVTSLSSSVASSAAALVVEQQTRATATESIANQTLSLAARTENNAAALVVEQLARTSATEALSQQTLTLAATTGENRAALVTEQQVRSDAVSATASQTLDLAARTGNNVAGLVVEQQARTDATSALSSQVTALVATTGENKAAISLEQTARTTATSAVASQVNTLVAATANNQAGITSEQIARTTATEAVASSTNSLIARTGDNAAGITSEQTARTTATSAVASRVDRLAVQSSDLTAGLSTEQTVRADANSVLASSVTSLVASSADANAKIASIETAKIGYSTQGGAAFDAGGTVVDKTTMTAYNTANAAVPGFVPLVWNVGLPLAKAVKQVSVTVNGVTGTIEDRMVAVAATANTIYAEKSVRIGADNSVVGYGLSGTINATTGVVTPAVTDSKFIVNVDQFAVSTPKTSIPLWLQLTSYALNAIVRITGADTKTLVCTQAGTTSTNTPDASQAIGSTLTDGSVKWQIASRIPFSVATGPFTHDGISVPAGTIIDGAFIRDATISSAKIGSLTADKISTGTLTAGIGIGAMAITSQAVTTTVGGVTTPKTFPLDTWDSVSGFYLGRNKFYVGNGSTRGLKWDGSSLEVTNATVNGTLLGGGATSFTSGTGLWAGMDDTTYKFRVGSSTSALSWDGEDVRVGGIPVSTLSRPIYYIGAFTSAPDVASQLKNYVYKNTTDGNSYIMSADAGVWGLYLEKGAPGTTPIKNVDYFDGTTPIKNVDYFDGTTPIKNVDYFDGTTPIKNVDYFDGSPGLIDTANTYTLGTNGGFYTGTIARNATTGVISGTGVAMTGRGIAAAVNGVGTFNLNGTTGEASFSGNLSAASGSFSGTLTAANIVSTSHIVDDAISARNNSSGTGATVSTTLTVPAGQTWKVVVLGYISNYSATGPASTAFTVGSTVLTLYSTVTGYIDIGDSSTPSYSYPAAAAGDVVSVSGGASGTTHTFSVVGISGASKFIIVFGAKK